MRQRTSIIAPKVRSCVNSGRSIFRTKSVFLRHVQNPGITCTPSLTHKKLVSMKQSDRHKHLAGNCFRMFKHVVGDSKGAEPTWAFVLAEGLTAWPTEEALRRKCTHGCFCIKDYFDTGVRPHLGCTCFMVRMIPPVTEVLFFFFEQVHP